MQFNKKKKEDLGILKFLKIGTLIHFMLKKTPQKTQKPNIGEMHCTHAFVKYCSTFLSINLSIFKIIMGNCL